MATAAPSAIDRMRDIGPSLWRRPSRSQTRFPEMKRDSSAVTVEQLIQTGAAQFERSGVWFGHGTDNAYDEAAELVFFAAGLSHEDAAEAYPRALDPQQVAGA